MAFNAKMPQAADFFKSDGTGLSAAGVRYLGQLEGAAKKLNELDEPDAVKEDFTVTVKFPEDDDEVTLDEKLAYGMTVTETTLRTGTGTATATWKINSTALTGAQTAATSTQASSEPSSNNVGEVDDRFYVALTDISDDLDYIVISGKFTRSIL